MVFSSVLPNSCSENEGEDLGIGERGEGDCIQLLVYPPNPPTPTMYTHVYGISSLRGFFMESVC